MSVFGRKIAEFYWFTFPAGFPVEMPALPRTKHFRWTGIYGLQLGPWFIGTIRGEAVSSEHQP